MANDEYSCNLIMQALVDECGLKKNRKTGCVFGFINGYLLLVRKVNRFKDRPNLPQSLVLSFSFCATTNNGDRLPDPEEFWRSRVQCAGSDRRDYIASILIEPMLEEEAISSIKKFLNKYTEFLAGHYFLNCNEMGKISFPKLYCDGKEFHFYDDVQYRVEMKIRDTEKELELKKKENYALGGGLAFIILALFASLNGFFFRIQNIDAVIAFVGAVLAMFVYSRYARKYSIASAVILSVIHVVVNVIALYVSEVMQLHIAMRAEAMNVSILDNFLHFFSQAKSFNWQLYLISDAIHLFTYVLMPCIVAFFVYFIFYKLLKSGDKLFEIN